MYMFILIYLVHHPTSLTKPAHAPPCFLNLERLALNPSHIRRGAHCEGSGHCLDARYIALRLEISAIPVRYPLLTLEGPKPTLCRAPVAEQDQVKKRQYILK